MIEVKAIFYSKKRRIHMSSEKDTFKNPSNEKPKKIDFSLQSSATKPLDMDRIIGKPSEEKIVDTTNNEATVQEGN